VSGGVSYQWTTVSGPGTLSYDTPQALSTNVTATVDGTYVIRLTATDSVGNSSAATVNFTYDTIPPDIAPVSSILTKTFVPVSPTVTGATRYAWTQKSGPGSLTFTAPFSATSNVSASADGSYVMTFTALDAVGNSASRDITFVWDTTAPVAVLSNRPASVTSSSAYNFTVSSVSTDYTQYRTALIPSVALCSEASYGSPVAAGTALAGTVPAEGTYTMCVLAGDPADNWQPAATATSYTWTVDSTPPTITLAATIDANAAKNVGASVVGASSYAWTQTSGSGTVTFNTASSMSPSVTANAEGAYTLQLRATDAAGNVATATTTFTWDTTAPVITPMSSITTNASFTLSPTITGATTYTWSKVSGSGTVTFGSINAASTTVSIVGDATYVLRVTATDAANNSATANVSVVYDTVAPVVGTLATVNARTTATLSPTVTGATVYSWTMQSGPGVITFGTPAAASTTASASLDGAYVLRLSATDAAGNTTVRDVNFNWDTVAPTITGMPTTVYANAEKTIAPTVSGATTLAWSKTTGSGTITFTPANTATSAVKSSAQGTFTLQLLASDAAGNQATATTQFIWDTAVPTAPTLSAGVTQVNGPFTVTATLNESVQGLDLTSSKIVLTNGTLTAVSPSSTTSTTSYALSVTPTGTPVTLQLLAGAVQDLSGNSNTAASAVLSLVYDPTPPVAPEAAAPTANVMVDGIGYNTALLKWFWASDTTTAQSAIKYYVSYSTSSSFDTVSQVMAGTRTAAMAQSSFASAYGCYTTPSTGTSQQCSYHLTGLQPQTTYYVNVVAEDTAGNRSVYTKASFTTLGLQPVFKKIAASQAGNSACGLAESGKVYCWGDNSAGTLGDGSQVSKSIPTAIDSSFTFVDIAVGTNHACAIRDNGTAYCWGAGANGQIGNGANTMVLSPTLVGSQIFTALALGDKFSCALQDDGKASCWGANSRGELGNGGTSDTNTPATISGTTVFRKLSAGSSHVCGIKEDGLVFCWGYNLNGQTGTNTSGAGTNKTTATQITGTLKFRELSLGHSHSCGITGNGAAYCWGKGNLGQIGNNAAADVSVPTLVSGTDKYISLAATTQSSCGIKDDGTLRCWGDNTLGELNTAGAQASSSTPVASSDGSRWISLIAGNSMFCGVQSSGTAFCWGSNNSDQLGVGDSINRSSSAAISMSNVTSPTLIKFKKIVVGDVTSCAISSTQDLWCWGNGVTTGELGVGARIFMKTSPLHVGSSKWMDVAMASNHACAINDAYEVYCWGRNAAYELGIASGDNVARYTPTKINGTRKYLSIAVAANSSCAAATDGQLVCWGSDAGSNSGNLASGAYTALQIPTASNDTTNQYVKVAGGDFHVCGVTVDGSARCWGRNTSGQLGNGGTTNQPSPANFDSSTRYVTIAAGAIHSCGVTAAGVVRCFGAGANGQMGNGTTTATNSTVTTPTWSPAKKVLGLSWSGAAMDHSCVTTSDYYSYCWGANASKQSNNSATNPITTPQQGNSTIISTSAGTTVSCQLSSQGDISCFGACDNGRCGQATPGTSDTQTATGAPLAVKVSGI
jgi:alpha-tubulin suppressor-like RCC1 family protein